MLDHCSLEIPGRFFGSLRSLFYLPSTGCCRAVGCRNPGTSPGHCYSTLWPSSRLVGAISDGWMNMCRCGLPVYPRVTQIGWVMFLMRCLKDINYGIWYSKLISYDVCGWNQWINDLQSSWKHLPWDLRSPLGFSWFHSEVNHSHTFLGRSNVEKRSGGAIFAGEAMVSCVATSLRQRVVK